MEVVPLLTSPPVSSLPMQAVMRYSEASRPPVEYMDAFVSSNDVRPMQNSYVSTT